MPIRPLLRSDWDDVREIYIQGMNTGMATFETEVPDFDVWIQSRIPKSAFVFEEDKIVLGWAALSPYSSRCVYGGVAEVSIYIHQDARAKGIGKKLMEHLISESEKLGIWTLQAGIFPENIPSIKLHEKFGFRLMGTSEKLGKLNGIWKDVSHLERRSKKII